MCWEFINQNKMITGFQALLAILIFALATGIQEWKGPNSWKETVMNWAMLVKNEMIFSGIKGYSFF